MDGLIDTVRTWIALDPDPVTRAAAEAMLARADRAELEESFGSRLQFGTAGMRGEMGPGPNRMNRVMVRQVSAGLSEHVRAQGGRRVVIGYDGRRNSKVFAEDAAAVFRADGLAVTLATDVLPTPILSYATVALGAGAGVMVTASHNPPADNGYKVYRANGAQIIPPDDALISGAIDAVGPISHLAPADSVDPLPQAIIDAYFADIAALRVHRETGARIVYTAMHGVGGPAVLRALGEAGHTDVHPVPEQQEPDGAFPTVAFPNPEEPGALDLAIALAQRVGADVILANDPDADRLAVAAPDAAGRWRQLTGNQVGVLLAADLLAHRDFEGKTPMVAMSIVSTAMLRPIAEAAGAAYAETLTGFKWIAHRAIEHDAEGGAFCLGFEEALGYSAGSVVRDKDGVSAVLLMADLVSHLKARGRTVWDALEALYRQHGLFVSGQHSLKAAGSEGQARIREIMQRLGAEPPTSVDGVPVRSTLDLAAGVERRADGTVHPATLPTSDVLAFNLEDGSRILVRPSGTEPKMKFYVEVRERIAIGEPLADALSRGEARLARMKAELLARAGV
jgi:phosphomannomutase